MSVSSLYTLTIHHLPLSRANTATKVTIFIIVLCYVSTPHTLHEAQIVVLSELLPLFRFSLCIISVTFVLFLVDERFDKVLLATKSLDACCAPAGRRSSIGNPALHPLSLRNF